MPSTLELRRRIKSVKSTRQITKAMELVSAAKMRRASEATLASRPYSEQAWQVLRDLTNQPIQDIRHPLIDARPVKNRLVFLISSDQSLAGAFNTNLMRKALHIMKDAEAAHQKVDFITIGKKGALSLAKVDASVIQTYQYASTHPTTSDILPIAQFMTQAFLKKEYDLVEVIYTEFYSMLRQEAEVIQILPLQPPVEELAEKGEKTNQPNLFVYEPGITKVLNYVLPRLVEVQIFQALLESLASEHSARRIAMKSATDNASDMVDDLTLTYNSVRQSNITREIAEITGGAAALES
jgi:F-type H+-transporting ATPase subunit gamma